MPEAPPERPARLRTALSVYADRQHAGEIEPQKRRDAVLVQQREGFLGRRRLLGRSPRGVLRLMEEEG